jgi:hypothetical protein
MPILSGIRSNKIKKEKKKKKTIKKKKRKEKKEKILSHGSKTKRR